MVLIDFPLSHIQLLELLQTRRNLQSIGVTDWHVGKALLMCTGEELCDVTSATVHWPSKSWNLWGNHGMWLKGDKQDEAKYHRYRAAIASYHSDDRCSDMP